MRLSEAMVWWNDDAEHECAPSPRLKVLSRRDDNRAFEYLRNSIGACFAGWENAAPARLAIHLLSIFVQATGKDGVPAAEAHREFMKIDEYREWHEQASGPFADAYWFWCAAKSTADQATAEHETRH